MAFKITPRTRIKIRSHVLTKIWFENRTTEFYSMWQWNFEESAGLKRTSQRASKFTKQLIYYYQVVDVNKYLLAKLKYGL